MKVITNDDLIAKRRKTANILAPVAMVILLAGFVLNIMSLGDQSINPTLFYGMLGLLAVGFILSSISSTLVNRWVKEPRADQALSQTLRGFNNKHVLINYTGVVPHVLITPTKLFVITAKNVDGVISVKDDRWKRKFSFIRMLRFFAEEGLGHPTVEAESNTRRLRNYLEEHLPEALDGENAVDIESLVVFTHPKVDLTVESSRLHVLPLQKVKSFIRQNTKGAGIKAEMRRDLLDVLGLDDDEDTA